VTTRSFKAVGHIDSGALVVAHGDPKDGRVRQADPHPSDIVEAEGETVVMTLVPPTNDVPLDAVPVFRRLPEGE